MGLLLPFLAGCATAARGGPSDFASILVQDRTTDEIRQAAAEVFTANFYVTKLSTLDRMIFEKAGSGIDNLAYGGWRRNQVAIRVKLHLTSAGERAYLVRCEAFMVRDAGDQAIEDEQQLSKLRRGPYQRLLEDIQTRLSRETPGSPTP